MSGLLPEHALATGGTGTVATRPSLQSWGELPLVMLVGLLAAGLALFEGPLVLRIPLGLLAAVFLPGYSLTAVLFPKADDLDAAERIALSLGLSLGLIISVLALLFNYTPWGVGHTPLVVGLTACTLTASMAATWRRGFVPPSERFVLRPRPDRWLGDGSSRLALGVLVAAALLAGIALTVTLTAPAPRFTEFFILGPEGLAENYPRTAAAGEEVTVTAGIINREGAPASYTVAVADSMDTRLASVGPQLLAAGEPWEGPVTFALPRAGKDQEVKLALLKDGEDYPYRTLRLWVDVLPASHSPTASPAPVASAAPVTSPLPALSATPAVPPTPVPSPTPAATPTSKPAAGLAPAPPSASARTYVVEAGDSLGSIAQQLYGDAHLWPRILDANRDILGDDPGALRFGMRLTIPPTASTSSTPSPVASRARKPADGSQSAQLAQAAPAYVVQPGDTFRTIAEQLYGDADRWPPIYEANKDLLGDDPDALRAGTLLTIPPAG